MSKVLSFFIVECVLLYFLSFHHYLLILFTLPQYMHSYPKKEKYGCWVCLS